MSTVHFVKPVLPAFAALVIGLTACATANATTLFGGASHSDYLPQEQPTLVHPYIKWIRIPGWMAGEWKKKGDLTIKVSDLRTGTTATTNEWTDDVMTIRFGHQLDSEGNVWHAYFIPSERDGNSNGRVVRFVTVDVTPQASAGDRFVDRAHYIVNESTQQEALNDYLALNGSELENYSSTRVYNYEGRPMREGLLVSRFKRVAPFSPLATREGVNLVESLNAYLESQGLAKLIRH
jgi:hypothetical protein